MYGYNNYRNPALTNELISDLWIEQNVPGGLDSPYGEILDNTMGGNPNPTYGQIMGGAPGVGGYGHGTYGVQYGYQYRRW
ncbi:unnamed protein product [Adineta ricciae]|uniref:Uncharacterized protein n=1 Tax=Adineta ricciae TaxID=249248 RepID=A0A815MIF3_ADIRI|nr:unnamed protein product [Adineta ricciae]CAF1618417.1 unnamed protein product [Adineta ricciae]